mmetsp:Transcript_47991/g.102049  ORF Transcript_47991/g.102049 Transcript_47991/m.102049 type:complete len:237 (-) Transcript_47991:105-815(-)
MMSEGFQDRMASSLSSGVASLFDSTMSATRSAVNSVNVIRSDESPFKPEQMVSLMEVEEDPNVICGVGINLALVHDPPLFVKTEHYTYITTIESLEPNAPAFRAGLKVDDVIIAIDGKRLEYGRQVYLPEDVAAMIRGPKGSRIFLTIERFGIDGGVKDFELIREPVGVVPPPPRYQQTQRTSSAISPESSPERKAMSVSPLFHRKQQSHQPLGQSPMPVTPEGQRQLGSFMDRLK